MSPAPGDTGLVASVQPYGVFIKIPGCSKNGLVHRSQMSSTAIDNPEEIMSVGEKVFCKVLSAEPDGSKIALSMKVVSQTTGKDLDPGNVQAALDERRKKSHNSHEKAPIELGAVLDTTCRKCGGKGHLAQDCFHRPGDKTYELVDEDDVNTSIETLTKCAVDADKHHSHKSKKHKKRKSKDSVVDDDDGQPKHKKHKKKKSKSERRDSTCSPSRTRNDRKS